MSLQRKELGELMLNWHSSMSDPIYAVGSYYLSDKVYPQVGIVGDALRVFIALLDETRRMALGEKVMVERQGKQINLKVYAGYTDEDIRENLHDLQEIVTHLNQFMTRDYK